MASKRPLLARLCLVLVVLGGIAGGGWWWWWARGSLSGGGIDGLARRAPADTQVFVAFSLRRTPSQLRRLGEWRKKLDDARLSSAMSRFEERLGVKLAEIIGWIDAAGMLVVLPPEGQTGLVPGGRDGVSARKPAEFVLCWAVRDEKAARADLDRIFKAQGSNLSVHEVDDEGVSLRVGGEGNDEWAVGLSHGFLMLGTGVAAVRRVVRAQIGKASNLAAEPFFQEARRGLPAADGLFVYVPVGVVAKGAGEKADLASSDRDRVEQATAAAHYLAGSVSDSQDPPCQGFLELDSASSNPIVKKLLESPGASGTDLEAYLPPDGTVYATANLSWIYQVLKTFPSGDAMTRALGPEASRQVGVDFDNLLTGKSPVRVAMAANLEQALRSNGRETPTLLYCADVPDPQKLVDALETAMGKARSQGRLVACRSNLKNIGTACEMFSTDHAGRYPTGLAELTPNYLRQVPTCPSAGSDTYSEGFTTRMIPAFYRVNCSGAHHLNAGVPAGYPAYSSSEGLEAPSMGTSTGSDGRPDRQERKVAGTSVYSYREDGNPQGPQLCWALAGDSARPVLLVAYGPGADSIMDRSLTQASEGKADKARYWGPLARSGQAPVVASSLNVKQLVQLLASALESNSGQGDADMSGVVGVLRQETWTDRSDQVVVEKNGLRYDCNTSWGGALGMGPALALVMVPNFFRARGQGQLTACKSNLKNLGTAMEMYSTDNHGRYPTTIGALTPNYLKTIPTCPAAGSSTYAEGFTSVSNPDLYTVVCTGHHHEGVNQGTNYPQYTSIQGLIAQ